MRKLVLLFAGVAALAACSVEPDYYEGPLVPVRPIHKPSLDPSTPEELGGGGPASDIPPIFEGKKLGDQTLVGGGLQDGRIQWAEDLQFNVRSYTYLHDVDGWTGIDTVTVLDEDGVALASFTTRYRAEQLEIAPAN